MALKILVSTCNKYDHLLPGFAMQWNRYWGAPVTVLGFRPPPPLPENFTFVSMAPVESMSWSAHLRDTIKNIENEEIVLLFDDYWLNGLVDQKKVEHMREWLVMPGVVKADLSRNTEHFAHTPLGDDIVVATKDAQYRTSTQPAVWSRAFLLKLLGTGEYNPWQFELQHRPEVVEGRIVGTREQIVPFANIYYKGSPASYMIDTIPSADLAELQASGAMDAIKPIP